MPSQAEVESVYAGETLRYYLRMTSATLRYHLRLKKPSQALWDF
ncbi:hypothetical protein [Microcoleus sp. FACHB-672]|nr:hypothetical protein [Microcoleus sp. FACHB-672]